MTWYVLYDKNKNILMKTKDKSIHPNLVEINEEPETGWDGKIYEKGKVPEKPESVYAKERIFSLKNELTGMDYKQFKYLRGELSNDEWLIVKNEIQKRTAEINRLEKLL